MLRLKEDPREWQKFAAVMGGVANLLAWLSWWRSKVPLALPLAVTAVALAALVIALMQPRLFRGFYRCGMAVSYCIGQAIGRVILTVFFFLIVTPLGLMLRLLGKDLLQLKRDPADQTWWKPVRNSREFDRMF